MNILLVDYPSLFREGLKCLLSEVPEFNIIGEAKNDAQALKICHEFKTDLILLEIDLPTLDAKEFLLELQKSKYAGKIMVLSFKHEECFLKDMLRLGVNGYLLKSSTREELLTGIKIVMDGGRYVSCQFALNMIKTSEEEATKNKTEVKFSKRETEILELIVQGFTNAEIAEKLNTSRRTVEVHRKNLNQKAGTKNTALLIKFAQDNNLLNQSV